MHRIVTGLCIREEFLGIPLSKIPNIKKIEAFKNTI